MSTDDLAVESVQLGLKKAGLYFSACASEALPDFVVADPMYGLVAIDVVHKASETPDEVAELKKLRSRRLRNLRLEIGDEDRNFEFRYLGIRVSNQDDLDSTVGKVRITTVDIPEATLEVKESPFFEEGIQAVKNRFNRSFVFSGKKRDRTLEDPSQRQSRENFRFILDKNQAELALGVTDGITLITGPAGSGKTLVLAARARILHELHPDWKIRVVCFNNALLPYLKSLMPVSKNISVETFYQYTTRTGDKFRMVNATENIAKLNLESLIYVSPSADAIIVDEGQDFFIPWLQYLNKTLRRERGGLLIAGDDNQSLYRSSELELTVKALGGQVHSLEKPYRSTRQITNFVNTLMPEVQMSADLVSLNGPLPEVTYIQGGLRENAQAYALALDILHALETDSSLKLNEIGVLCSRYFEMNAIWTTLNTVLELELGKKGLVWGQRRSRDPRSTEYSPNDETIKLMTIHSAKGLEFRYVFLLGLEEIARSFEELPANYSQIEELRETRLNFVGPTRAKDKLVVYYSKDNLFLRRLHKNKETFQERRYPEDYEVPTKWLS